MSLWEEKSMALRDNNGKIHPDLIIREANKKNGEKPMGMTTCVRGFVSGFDETYQKHSKVLIACIEAGIKRLPEETAEYFGEKSPEKYLLENRLEVKIPFHKYTGDMEEGVER